MSPLLSIALGIFLCWWTRKMRLQFRWGFLILYGVSPMLAHGFALGRPDHQSLLITLIAVALCAEWMFAQQATRGWGIVSGASWALALWVGERSADSNRHRSDGVHLRNGRHRRPPRPRRAPADLRIPGSTTASLARVCRGPEGAHGGTPTPASRPGHPRRSDRRPFGQPGASCGADPHRGGRREAPTGGVAP